MALSKTARILILLAIDTVFFLIELIIGYAVHSLALVADSFHMFNDVLSLCVGLWAVRVANQKTSSKMYTYGWQRAETLGALINGVFLVALCLTIFLEAIQRFVEPQEVSHPMLVLIVGCLGLLSNLVGLFLFHDHGHGHGAAAESHEHTDEVDAAEHGHGPTEHGHDTNAADEADNVASVMPQNVVTSPTVPKHKHNTSIQFQEGSTHAEDGHSGLGRTESGPFSPKRKSSRSRSRTLSMLEDVPISPSNFRRSIIDASRVENYTNDTNTAENAVAEGDNDSNTQHASQNGSSQTEPLLQQPQSNGYGSIDARLIDHKAHKHAQPKEADGHGHGHGHGHSHADLNMRGMFLHVMGDALGNIGVISSALFIWLTDFSWRFYTDPAISLIITVIILCSAIPLCKAASRILLQAVPAGLSIDDIKEDIEDLPGIVSCHHLHVWQLSDTRFVASLHVKLSFEFKGEGSARYMILARAIRECLHEHGIHSSTIQPEFYLDNGDLSPTTARDGSNADGSSKQGSQAASLREPSACLLDCGDACGKDAGCC